jgi:hypothetical protein
MAQAKINGKIVAVPDDFFEMDPQQQQKFANRTAARQTSGNPSQMMQDITAYGRYLERQDIKDKVSDNNSLQDFGLSAGVGIGKMAMGVGDLLGFGPSDETARNIETLDGVLAEQSPTANFTGRMAGGAAAAIPTAAVALRAAPAQSLGFAGRAFLSGITGSADGAIELPFSDESRLGNTAVGAVSGLAGEGIMTTLQQVLKRIPFGALVDRASGLSETIRDKAAQVFKDAGYEYDALKQTTKDILESIGRSDDVDVAIKNAMENEQGFKLTAGEASQDFAQLGREQDAARQSSEAGTIFRDFKAEQNQDIISASDELAEATGGNVVNNQEQVGEVLKVALLNAKESDQAAVKMAYDAAQELAEKSNIHMPLDQRVISDVFYDISEKNIGTHGGLLKDIGRELARLGILDPEEFNADLPFKLPGGDSVFGDLSVANTEQFIKFLNSKYMEGDSVGNAILAQIKQAVGDNADTVIARGLEGADSAAAKVFIKQAREARALNKEYYDLWEAKDVLQDTTGVKVGTDTPVQSASDMVKRITKNPESARQVIDELSTRGNDAAVNDLRTFILKDMFDKSLKPNVDGSDIPFFSGSSLSTAMKKNDDLLQAVLTPDQYAGLKGFESQVSKATKYPPGTVNHSNTASKILEALFSTLTLLQYNMGADFKAMGGNKVIKDAIKTKGRANVDYILKLDGNHVKLNTVLKQALEQVTFSDSAVLTEEDEQETVTKRGVLSQ